MAVACRSPVGHEGTAELVVRFKSTRTHLPSFNDRFLTSELRVAPPQPGHERSLVSATMRSFKRRSSQASGLSMARDCARIVADFCAMALNCVESHVGQTINRGMLLLALLPSCAESNQPVLIALAMSFSAGIDIYRQLSPDAERAALFISRRVVKKPT